MTRLSAPSAAQKRQPVVAAQFLDQSLSILMVQHGLLQGGQASHIANALGDGCAVKVRPKADIVFAQVGDQVVKVRQRKQATLICGLQVA